MSDELMTLSELTMLLIGAVGYFAASAFMRHRAKQQAIKDAELKMEMNLLRMEVQQLQAGTVGKRKNDEYYVEGDD